MTMRPHHLAMITAACCLMLGACSRPPGKPGPQVEASRPEQVSSFDTLYKENCAACHGEKGRGGAAISLANPAYIATAGAANIQRITAQGVPGTLMPAFGKASGGPLTDAQIGILTQGIVSWGNASEFAGNTPLPYASSTQGDAGRGQISYATYCASCHGNAPPAGNVARSGSILDPTYLALISDQGLRSMVITGHTAPRIDWRSFPSVAGPRALTDADATDIIAWMASQRVSTPGQPYPQHP